MSDSEMWLELERVIPEVTSTRTRIERHLEAMSDEEFISFIEWLVDGDEDDEDDKDEDEDDEDEEVDDDDDEFNDWMLRN